MVSVRLPKIQPNTNRLVLARTPIVFGRQDGIEVVRSAGLTGHFFEPLYGRRFCKIRPKQALPLGEQFIRIQICIGHRAKIVSELVSKLAAMSPQQQADVLSQALPYIQAFRGQTFVVKYGGSAMRDPSLLEGVIRNVLLLQLVGIRCILVHGGGPEIDTWLGKLGVEKRVHQGLRITDDFTMEVVEMALAGRANKTLVAEVQKAGGKAMGLSGRDGDLLVGRAVSEELGRVGEVTHVNPDILQVATEAGYIPVVCSVATDENHHPLNVNADIAAGAIAAAVGATKLVLLTDTNGVLGDKDDASSTVSRLSIAQAQSMLSSGRADRGMIPKLQSAVTALESGVQSVHMINGSTANALLIEVFTDHGIGTMMTA